MVSMKKLNKNWITEKIIDFEYKQYILLAYLSGVEKDFGKVKLYPHLSELTEHHKNAKILKEQFHQIGQSFPKKLIGFKRDTLQLEFQSLINDNSIIQEILQIIDFSLPKFESYLKEGKKIYDSIESKTNISSVGIIPLNNEFGYVFLKNAASKIRAYKYEISLFEREDEKYRGIHMKYIASFRVGINSNFEQIKLSLIKRFYQWPNPATYAIETDLAIPFNETFLPIAKRLLMKTIQISY